MREQAREARITLGSKSYNLDTTLDREQFGKVETMCQNLYRHLAPANDHEKRLVLGWMVMAYKLQQAEEKLSLLLEKYQFPAATGESGGDRR